MSKKQLSRRDFNRLSALALGGMASGLAVGCSNNAAPDPVATNNPTTDDPATTNVAMGNPHACRGLNECKGQGKDGNNDCAGSGSCANIPNHVCAGHNDCKNQGGCGAEPGANECSGKGGCEVPLMDEDTWKKARKLFEERMVKAGKEVLEAPAKMM